MPFDRVTFVNGGDCAQLGWFAGSAKRGVTRFNDVFLVLEHARHGVSLIDTGYSTFFLEATRPFPQRLYRWLLPVRLAPERAIENVNAIFISHFHGDHVAGVRRFPDARFVYRRGAHDTLMRQSPLRQTCHGFLAALLPDDFTQRGPGIEDDAFAPGSGRFAGFRVVDYYGDGDLLLVDLPGHAPGHTGFAVRTSRGDFFYIADACWDRDAMLAGRRLPRVSRWLQHSMDAYDDTQARLRRFAAHDDWPMLACHCPHTQDYVD